MIESRLEWSQQQTRKTNLTLKGTFTSPKCVWTLAPGVYNMGPFESKLLTHYNWCWEPLWNQIILNWSCCGSPIESKVLTHYNWFWGRLWNQSTYELVSFWGPFNEVWKQSTYAFQWQLGGTLWKQITSKLQLLLGGPLKAKFLNITVSVGGPLKAEYLWSVLRWVDDKFFTKSKKNLCA